MTYKQLKALDERIAERRRDEAFMERLRGRLVSERALFERLARS